MSHAYRVVMRSVGGGGAGENVVWEGTADELRVEFGDDPEANPIEETRSGGPYTLMRVLQRSTGSGWEDCADPRSRSSGSGPPP